MDENCFYFGVTAVFYVLYFLKIFGVPEMLLVMLPEMLPGMLPEILPEMLPGMLPAMLPVMLPEYKENRRTDTYVQYSGLLAILFIKKGM